MIAKVKSGEITEVVLKPKKPGFFLPDGTFIEAFDYAPAFGEDLGEAERRWEVEEEDRVWADEENQRFNKAVVDNVPRFGEAMWHHGERIETYAKQKQRSVSALLHLLDRRRGPDGYARHTHQTSVDFYRWKPHLQESDSLLSWKWERIDSVLRFSTANHVRNHLQSILESTALRGIRDDQLSRLLGIKTREADQSLERDEANLLQELRSVIRSLRVPDPTLVERAIRIVGKSRRPEQSDPDSSEA